MSNYFANLSLFGARQNRVAEAIRTGLPGRPCFVSPTIKNWVTIYPADSETDPDCLAEIAKVVCPPCKCPGVGLAVHGETMLTYWLFDRQGQLQQVFDLSADGRDADHSGIAHLAKPKESAADIAAIMQGPDAAMRLAKLLRIVNVEYSYSQLVEEEGVGPGEELLHIDGAAPTQEEPSTSSLSLSASLTDPFVFPRCLHGDHRSVRTAWAKVMRKAWKDGSWDRALIDMDFCSVHSLPGQIMTREFRYGKAKESHWRMYWIGQLLCDTTCYASGDRMANVERMDHLIGDGMRWFWIALGLLETNGSIFLEAWPRRRPLVDVKQGIFSGFVSWLPQLAELGKRYDFDEYPWWIGNILHMAPERCGFTSYADFVARYGVNVIQALLETQAIEAHPDGFRLRLAPGKL